MRQREILNAAKEQAGIMACHGQQALRSAMSERQDRAHRNFRL